MLILSDGLKDRKGECYYQYRIQKNCTNSDNYEKKSKRSKSMNGKRVKSAIMSAVILSAVAVSGCSADGGVSLNESGVKAELSAFFNTSGKDKSAETESRTSSDSISVSTTEKKPETTAVTTKNDSMTKSE